MKSTPSPRRTFPSSDFVTLDATQKIEEEELPGYDPEDYYPVYIGEVFNSRYQVVTKLGFGTREHRYFTLKICVRTTRHDHECKRDEREIAASNHLKCFTTKHPGKETIRKVLDSFEVIGPSGIHKCLLHHPLGMNLTELLKFLPQHRLPTELTQLSVRYLLIALDYLHQCQVVHTDISPNNVLHRIQDDSILSQLEQGEVDRPTARKVLSDRTIYNSREMPLDIGLPVLCDLGEARVGNEKHRGDIMPGIYRAPEIVLGMCWDAKVDIWAIGVMTWQFLEGDHLFFAEQGGILNDEQHLAEMVALLGPPPPDFLKRSEESHQYWDNQGNWKGSVPIPDQSFESRECFLNNDDRALFLRFIRRTLRWIPEERPVAVELVFDDFLTQPEMAS